METRSRIISRAVSQGLAKTGGLVLGTTVAIAGLCGVLSAHSAAAGVPSSQPVPLDLTRRPTLFVVGYAHLDTEWRRALEHDQAAVGAMTAKAR